VADRCEQLLDAISLLGDRGVRAVTHRAVDAQAGLPVGSTSNHFRTRDALFDGVAERFSARERANWEHLAGRPAVADDAGGVGYGGVGLRRGRHEDSPDPQPWPGTRC